VAASTAASSPSPDVALGDTADVALGDTADVALGDTADVALGDTADVALSASSPIWVAPSAAVGMLGSALPNSHKKASTGPLRPAALRSPGVSTPAMAACAGSNSPPAASFALYTLAIRI